MAKFSGGKLNKKNGVLSYKYAAKPGGKENNIYIKQDENSGDWHFVDKQGKVRDTLADGGKLSSTHINNLKGTPGSSEENIFASAKVNPETGGSVSNKPEIVSTPRDGVNINSSGKLAPALAERSNLRLRDAKEATAPSLSSSSKEPIDYEKTLERRGAVTAPSTLQSEAYTGPGTSNWAPGPGELNAGGTSTQVNMPMSYSSGGDWSPGASPTTDGGFTSSNFGAGREMGIGDNKNNPNPLPPSTGYNPNEQGNEPNEYEAKFGEVDQGPSGESLDKWGRSGRYASTFPGREGFLGTNLGKKKSRFSR